MALRFFSTCKEWKWERTHSKSAQGSQASQPIQSSVCHALVFLGMGVEGMNCDGDAPSSGKR